MRWIKEWKRRRDIKRGFNIIVGMLEEHLESGKRLDTFLVPHFAEPVEWNTPGQYWFISVTDPEDAVYIDLRMGMIIVLDSGRGGAQEPAMIVERVESFDGGGGVYRLSFDLPVDGGLSIGLD